MNEFNTNGFNREYVSVENERARDNLQAVMVKTFAFMLCGLLISAVSAWLTYQSGVANNPEFMTAFFAFAILELVLVFLTSSLIRKELTMPAAISGVAYCVVNGVTLSVVFLAYEMTSIITVFFLTAGIFGMMSAYGYFTKSDLTSIGRICMFGLIGMIIVTLVNVLLLKSAGLDLLLAYVGVAIFMAITAYDIQKIKTMYQVSRMSENSVALYGALNIYLDFINLFLKILRILGKRR